MRTILAVSRVALLAARHREPPSKGGADRACPRPSAQASWTIIRRGLPTRLLREPLERLIERLEHAAATLRAGELEPDRAAALVEECARIAAEAGAELDREVRAADAPGQLALGS